MVLGNDMRCDLRLRKEAKAMYVSLLLTANAGSFVICVYGCLEDGIW